MSKGLKSGSALDIAKKIDHTEAIRLLTSKTAQMNL